MNTPVVYNKYDFTSRCYSAAKEFLFPASKLYRSEAREPGEESSIPSDPAAVFNQPAPEPCCAAAGVVCNPITGPHKPFPAPAQHYACRHCALFPELFRRTNQTLMRGWGPGRS